MSSSLIDICHRRSTLAALVVADVPNDVLDTVHSRFRHGRLTPKDTRLELIHHHPELIGADLAAARTYARTHFANDPASPFIPCFFVLADAQTTRDGSVLFVQQDWPASPDNAMRVFPVHLSAVYTAFLLYSTEWEECLEERLNDDGIYDWPPGEDAGRPNRPGVQAHVEFPASVATLQNETAETRTYSLSASAAQQLGLSAVERTVVLRKREGEAFAERLGLDVKPSEVETPSEQLRVWTYADYL